MTSSLFFVAGLSDLADMFKGASLSGLAAGIRETFQRPTDNLTLTLLLLAIAVLLVLLLVLGALVSLVPGGKRVKRIRRYRVRPPHASKPAAGLAFRLQPRRPIQRGRDSLVQRSAAWLRMHVGPVLEPAMTWLSTGWGIGTLVFLAVASTYSLSGTEMYCAETCHAGHGAVTAATELEHADCISCHEVGGLGGIPGNATARVRMVVGRIAGESVETSASVSSTACLSCHRDIYETTLTSERGIKVSHKEILEAGQPCTACHEGTGHAPGSYDRGMSPCITCHDNVEVSAACELCHAERQSAKFVIDDETGKIVGTGDLNYPYVRAAVRECDGCHDLAGECDPCHGGFRMPHTEEFMDIGHAREAAFEKKDRCWRCHNVWTDCANPCHSGFRVGRPTGHPPSWKADHARSGWDSMCGCHQRYDRRTTPMCPICHDR